MTVTLASFRSGYPEFNNTADTLVSKKLANAELRTAGLDVWDTESARDAAVELLTAHLLSVSPQGEEARINAGAETVYGRELRMLRREATIGIGRVT